LESKSVQILNDFNGFSDEEADSATRAFSSEVGTGSREENASEQEARASVPIQSERKKL
jgi:hypothetical protein